MHELLTPRQMALADQLTIDGGTPGINLMESAGAFLAKVTQAHFADADRVLVVCGPGNNGGDGFVLARLLSEAGFAVELNIPLGTGKINGDAKIAFERLPREVSQADAPEWDSYELIVDALFGAGLAKDIEGELGKTVSSINASPARIMAVDLPSGINGETGALCGNAVISDVTATFFRLKPGHLLLPGRSHCGLTEVGQIGIQNAVLDEVGAKTFHNTPALWEACLPIHHITQHKYSRGHTLAVSGPITKSGAARLMASAALRMGSGLVTLASSAEVLAIHAARLDSVMFAQAGNADELRQLFADSRLDCICMGPGMPPDDTTRASVSQALEANKNTVLDAGGLTAFEGQQDALLNQISSHQRSVVITPHPGEFERLFPDLAKMASRLEMARQAALVLSATIVLKGPDTIVADGDGRAAIASNAPPWLATAGSGDVLTGMIAGLMAQGMRGFKAACAAVWIHGEAASIIGSGLVSSDMDYGIQQVIRSRRLFDPDRFS